MFLSHNLTIESMHYILIHYANLVEGLMNEGDLYVQFSVLKSNALDK